MTPNSLYIDKGVALVISKNRDISCVDCGWCMPIDDDEKVGCSYWKCNVLKNDFCHHFEGGDVYD